MSDRAENLKRAFANMQAGKGYVITQKDISDALEEIRVLTKERDDCAKEAADRIESDAAKIESLQRENENLKLQAEGWAQEARTANGTIAEIYQIVTDSTGEPGNWHGAEPVRRRIAELEAAAITPEMRERMERAIAMYEAASCIEEYEEWAHGYAIDAFRDLLGEQG